ncbi:MAG: hypothetical protein DRH11_17060 [Deltaproteobacteria bacterium]|nr:MAG: hypothetical protein DRH11_17060 [Deltaproteobacteria bacterium]
MNIFPLFQTVLYTISAALLYPVVILLIVLSGWLVIYAGGFFAEWIKRRRSDCNSLLVQSLDTIRKEKRLPAELAKEMPLHLTRYAKELVGTVQSGDLFTEERIEDLIQRKECSLMREVAKIRMIVRIGPSLGLMGTLIPMGTGLAGLTQGNMAQLSSSLILAFTTTVVGLALGVAAHFFSSVKEGWIIEDMRNIELIAEAMTKGRYETTGEVYDEIPEKKASGISF